MIRAQCSWMKSCGARWLGGSPPPSFDGFAAAAHHHQNKRPFRTKNRTESKFTTARQKRCGKSKTLRRVLRSACFSWKKRQENGTDSKKKPKHAKNSQNSCFSAVFPAVFRLFDRDPLGTFFGCFPGCCQCRAFGTSVDGHRDCNART